MTVAQNSKITRTGKYSAGWILAVNGPQNLAVYPHPKYLLRLTWYLKLTVWMEASEPSGPTNGRAARANIRVSARSADLRRGTPLFCGGHKRPKSGDCQ